jgi:hypothetical protein
MKAVRAIAGGALFIIGCLLLFYLLFVANTTFMP